MITDVADPDPLVATLRHRGCVFAEEEAAILREAARDVEHLAALVQARCAGTPVEHLAGWVDFGNLRLSVGPGVFVPRQRTLLLAEAAVKAVESALAEDPRTAVFVEPFAGVAPVAASVLAAHPEVDVHVTDTDESALTHARTNLGTHAGVHHGEGLTVLPSRLRGSVAVIAAVPPYVPDAHVDLLPREAKEYEPAVALFGGHDGLTHVRELLAQSRRWLKPHGRLLMEMNEAQLDGAVDAASLHGFSSTHHLGVDEQTVVLELRLVAPPSSPQR